MLNLVSLIIGVVALPLRDRRLPAAARLGQLADRPAGDHRRGGRHDVEQQRGRNLNLFVIVIGIFRLMLGGGIL